MQDESCRFHAVQPGWTLCLCGKKCFKYSLDTRILKSCQLTFRDVPEALVVYDTLPANVTTPLGSFCLIAQDSLKNPL